MERLAKAGKGLNTYVSQNVRENYRKKLEEETFIKPNPVMANKLSITKIGSTTFFGGLRNYPCFGGSNNA